MLLERGSKGGPRSRQFWAAAPHRQAGCARGRGHYLIRSLYIDNLADKVFREKIDGVSRREKFRIRYYNGDSSLIHLEKKSKLNGLETKATAELQAKVFLENNTKR